VVATRCYNLIAQKPGHVIYVITRYLIPFIETVCSMMKYFKPAEKWFDG
jgi:hypothetical protein